jgi:TonB family protein
MNNRGIFLAFALVTAWPVYAVDDSWLSERYSVRIGLGSIDLGRIDAPIPERVSTPQYPADPLRASVSGRVTLDFTVGEDGSVSEVRVVNSTFDGLTNYTKGIVEQWRFTPAHIHRDRKPTAARMRCLVEYLIDEGAPNHHLSTTDQAKSGSGEVSGER